MISTIFQYGLKDHSFTCILSHVVERDVSPKGSVRENPPNVVPPITGFWLRDPASPKRGFSRFVVQSRPMTTSSGAAFFDLDRTLLAGASGEVFASTMRAAGLGGRSIPGEALLFRLFNTVGETLPSMALARQAVLLAKGKSRTRRARGSRDGRRAAGGTGATPGSATVRRAPRRWASSGDGHDHAIRHGQAVGRPLGSRRRRRHHVRGQRRRNLRRNPERSVRVECRQARRGPPLGRRAWGRSRRQLCVQRQRVRHPAARRGGSSRSWSTRIPAWP